jgi:hypothetical protein
VVALTGLAVGQQRQPIADRVQHLPHRRAGVGRRQAPHQVRHPDPASHLPMVGEGGFSPTSPICAADVENAAAAPTTS